MWNNEKPKNAYDKTKIYFLFRTLLIELSILYCFVTPVFVIKVLAFLLTMLISNQCMYYVFYIKL